MKGGNEKKRRKKKATSLSHLETLSQNFSTFAAASAPRSTAPSKRERMVGFLILRETVLLFIFNEVRRFGGKKRLKVEVERGAGAHFVENEKQSNR